MSWQEDGRSDPRWLAVLLILACVGGVGLCMLLDRRAAMQAMTPHWSQPVQSPRVSPRRVVLPIEGTQGEWCAVGNDGDRTFALARCRNLPELTER